jgi:UDP:flavonoid glycosyltransferase YjiC (YdhE family)
MGSPLVVLPLFSIDQWANADAVSRAGAGIALDAERGSRRVLDLPSAATLEGLAGAVRRVLGESTYRQAARRIAGAISEMPPAESAVEVLAAIAGERLE